MKLLNMSDVDILSTVKPMAKNMEEGWNENNYKLFSRDLTEETMIKFDADCLNDQHLEAYKKLGNQSIGELMAIHKNPDNLVVIWKVEYEKRQSPGVVIYQFSESEGKLVITSSHSHS